MGHNISKVFCLAHASTVYSSVRSYKINKDGQWIVDLQTIDFEPQQIRACAMAGQHNNKANPCQLSCFSESRLLECQTPLSQRGWCGQHHLSSTSWTLAQGSKRSAPQSSTCHKTTYEHASSSKIPEYRQRRRRKQSALANLCTIQQRTVWKSAAVGPEAS